MEVGIFSRNGGVFASETGVFQAEEACLMRLSRDSREGQEREVREACFKSRRRVISSDGCLFEAN